MELVEFSQCALGAVSKKPMVVGFVGAKSEDFTKLKCTHSTHVALCGIDENGFFRTRAAQAYAPDMCQALAKLHVTGWENRDPLSASMAGQD